MLENFTKNTSGAVVIIFSLALIPVLGLAGSAIDYSRAQERKTDLQAALDAASLAAARDMRRFPSDAALRSHAERFFFENWPHSEIPTITSFQIDRKQGKAAFKAITKVQPTLLKIVGVNNLALKAESESMISQTKVEIVMVLDNTGSMAGSKIRDLRNAAEALVDQLANAGDRADIKVGLVPFTAMVNVGSANISSSWIDRTGASSIHAEGVGAGISRLDVYASLQNANWDGCVEARPSPYDVTDDAPARANADTLIVPAFAPDDADGATPSVNNYLSDIALVGAFGKYTNATINTGTAAGMQKGPGFLCTSAPIQPLTNNNRSIKNSIRSMRAHGYTNLHQGIMWGWRVISPGSPFTEGAPYSDKDTRKIIVFMTDGQNTQFMPSGRTEPVYSAYGINASARLGATRGNYFSYVDAMDRKTLQGCENTKANEIEIYTVGFMLPDNRTKNLMRECATKSDMAFLAENGSDLINTFKKIADEIGVLRIAK